MGDWFARIFLYVCLVLIFGWVASSWDRFNKELDKESPARILFWRFVIFIWRLALFGVSIWIFSLWETQH